MVISHGILRRHTVSQHLVWALRLIFWDKATVNPACHIGQLVSSTGKKNKRNPNSIYTHHITLGKLNAKNSGSNEFQTSASIPITSHETKPFIRQKFVSIVSQQYFGRPMRLCPAGCQANTLFILWEKNDKSVKQEATRTADALVTCLKEVRLAHMFPKLRF